MSEKDPNEGVDWFNTGWETLDDPNKWMNKGKFKDTGPARFWVKPGTTVRSMFLDNVPFMFWERNWRMDGHWRNWMIHLQRNGLAEVDPLDAVFTDPKTNDLTNWPYYIGFLTVIDFSAWTAKDGTKIQYSRKLYGAKAGSKKKPGPLHKIRRLQQKYGDLTGHVFDIFRGGDQDPSVGTDFDLVEKVDPKDIEKYAKSLGVDWEKRPWTPFKYRDVFKPMSIQAAQALADKLKKIAPEGGGDEDVGYKVSDGGGGTGKPAGGGGDGWTDNGADEDIPF